MSQLFIPILKRSTKELLDIKYSLPRDWFVSVKDQAKEELLKRSFSEIQEQQLVQKLVEEEYSENAIVKKGYTWLQMMTILIFGPILFESVKTVNL